MASIDDFAKLELRVGRITGVEDVEGARKPLYRLSIDLGAEIGTRTIVAGVKSFYSREQLLNKQVVCIVNLDPKQIAGVESSGMLLAAEDDTGIAFLTPERELAEGSRVR